MTTMIFGTRGSSLAITQAESCAEKLRAAGFEVEIRTIKTTSDRHPDKPLGVIDQRDVFTRQLDEAVLFGEVDLAVHSLKDVPTEVPEGISLAAIGERVDPSDALVSEQVWDVDGLPDGAVVATSSLRRRSQLLHRRPDLRIVEIRGNVDTRIRKMQEGQADALVLARAGLERLGLSVPHTVIPKDVLLPAVGQGALAVAMRADHPLLERVREVLNHELTELAVLAEREMLRTLEGGCRVPIGANAVVEDKTIRLQGAVASTDGALLYRSDAEGEEPEELGRRVARDLLEQGAAVILDEIRRVRS